MPNTSDLLALLHTSSPLSLIHRYLDVQTMDSAEILQMIRTTPMNLADDDEYVGDRRISKGGRVSSRTNRTVFSSSLSS